MSIRGCGILNGGLTSHGRPKLRNSMLKILNLLPRIPTPTVDGGAIAVYNNLVHLKRQGMDVVVAAFESNRHPQDPEQTRREFPLYTVPANFREYDPVSAFKNLFDARPYNLALRFDRDTFRDLLRTVKRDHPGFDIVQCDWVYMAPYVALVKELWPDAKLVLRQHNAEYIIFGRMAEHESKLHNRMFMNLQTSKMKRYEARALTWFDHVIALTDVDRKLFEEMIPSGSSNRPGFSTLPVGVDLDTFRRDPNTPRKKQFLILGSMGWAPYVQALLWFLHQVWMDVHEALPEYKLIIAGGGAPDEITRFHGHYNIEVIGFVSEVVPLLHESAAMIVPLKSGSGMRIKIIEAMAAELPIITTSVGCEGIPILHQQDCIIGNTVDELHQAIIDFARLEDQGNRLASNALRIASEQFSWDSISRNTVELYRNIVV
jgi:polysaccharide biosynthesis protein PslH